MDDLYSLLSFTCFVFSSFVPFDEECGGVVFAGHFEAGPNLAINFLETPQTNVLQYSVLGDVVALPAADYLGFAGREDHPEGGFFATLDPGGGPGVVAHLGVVVLELVLQLVLGDEEGSVRTEHSAGHVHVTHIGREILVVVCVGVQVALHDA